MAKLLYEDAKLRVRTVGFGLWHCFLIKDVTTGKRVEIVSAQFTSMVYRYKVRDKDYGSFPHGGFTINSDNTVTIYHDDNQEEHEVVLTEDDLKRICSEYGIAWDSI